MGVAPFLILMRSSTASIQYSGFRIQNVDFLVSC